MNSSILVEHIFFNSRDNILLEGIFHNAGQPDAVVIAHPHPLYGGNMNNDVIGLVEQAYLEKGYATLRFNFRGVGKSHGSYADGKGEIDDLMGAIDYVGKNNSTRIVVVGYSFGAWVSAHIPKEMQPEKLVMLSPPVAMMDFSTASAIPSLKLVITGRNDEIAPPELIEKHLALWNPSADLRVIEHCDHFYGAGLPKLKMILTENL